MRFPRVMISLHGLLFGALGVSLWVAPELISSRFNIGNLDLAHVESFRGGLAEFFLMLSALCLVGLWTNRRHLLTAAAVMVGAVVVVRSVGWAVSGELIGLPRMLMVELGMVAAIVIHAFGARRRPIPKQA